MNIIHELESLNFSSIEPEDILYVITSHLNDYYPLAPIDKLDIDFQSCVHTERISLVGIQVNIYLKTTVFYLYYPELAI